jgi:hypothetical protein
MAYDLAPKTNDILYLVKRDTEQVLVLLANGERQEMLYGQFENPLFDPTGEQFYVRISDPEPGLIIGQESAPAGIYTQFRTGGRPSLVLADRPTATLTTTVRPLAFTPAGILLLSVIDEPTYEQAIGIFDPALGDIQRLPCCAFAFSQDNTLLYTAGTTDYASGTAQIVRVAAGGGSPTSLPPQFFSIGPIVATANGDLLAFTVPTDHIAGQDPIMDLQRISAEGSVTPLRNDTYALYAAAWAADASGAVVSLYRQNGAADPLDLEPLRWLPADPAAAEVPLAGKGTQLRFAK